MLTLLEQPSPITLSRNPAIFQLRARNNNGAAFTGKGVYAEMLLSQLFANGDSFTLNWTEADQSSHSITFTAVASPSAYNEIPDNSFGGTTIEYMKQIRQILQQHPELTLKFDITSSTDDGTVFSFRICAKAVDPDWSIEIVASTFTSSHNTITPDSTPENYKVLVEVLFQPAYNSGNFIRSCTLWDTPNEFGMLTFDLSDVLHSELKNTMLDPALPAFGNNTPFLANNTRNYLIRYTEKFGAPAEAQTWSFSPIKKVMYGGESKERHQLCQFFDHLSATNSLLTWYPDGKSVSLDTPEYLPWINFTDGLKKAFLQVQLFDAEQINPVATLNKFTTGNHPVVDQYETLLMPVGYNQLNLATENIDVKKYTVQLFDLEVFNEDQSLIPLSQVRSYYVDPNTHLTKRHLFYLNGFNVPMTLRLTGLHKEKLNVQRYKSNRILKPGESLLRGETIQHDQQFNQATTYRSGYLSHNEVQALQELLIYNQVFELFSDGYRRIDLTGKKFEITESLRYLHALEFEADPSVHLVSYSNYLIPCGANNHLCGLGNWQTANDLCWRSSDNLNWKRI